MRENNSLRSFGEVVTVALDKPTKATFKQLAGDMAVSHYLRALAARELAKTGKGRSLPGYESQTSEAILPVIADNVKHSVSLLEAIKLAVTTPRSLTKEDIAKVESSQLSFLTDKEIIATGKAAVAAVVSWRSRVLVAWSILTKGVVSVK